MDLVKTIGKILGTKPLEIGEINRLVSRKDVNTMRETKDPLGVLKKLLMQKLMHGVNVCRNVINMSH